MPNGDHMEDTRATWERVRDLERDLSEQRRENRRFREENAKLAEKIAALAGLVVLKMVLEEGRRPPGYRLRKAASAALHYMRLHRYADQAWADDLADALEAADE